MSQFLRKAQAIIGKKDETDSLIVGSLRITFNIKKTATAKANKASIEIYNLSKLSRDIVDDLDQRITLNVGYEQKRPTFQEVINDNILRTIFVGKFTSIIHEHKGTEWISQFTAGDGINLLNSKKVSVGHGKGKKVLDVLKDMIRQAGVSIVDRLENILSPEQQSKRLSKGFNFTGLMKDGFTKIANALDLNWSIQNDDIKFLRKGVADQTEIELIDRTTGMIESPQRLREPKNKAKPSNYRPGYMVKTLLKPTLEPGKLIHVKSIIDDLDTDFIVAEIEHAGDTHGDIWESRIKAIFK